MNKRLLVFYIVMLSAGLTVCPVHAEVRPWKIDKEHTNFYFSVDHIYAKVQCRLTLDRLAYNVGDGKYYHMGAVGKDVEIQVTIEALRKKIIQMMKDSHDPHTLSTTSHSGRCLALLSI